MTLVRPLKILCFGVIGVLYLANVLTFGYFVDGTIYTTIAHNFYQGVGGMWQPTFSKFIMAEFYEHPTLAFWLQSLTFHLFGNAFWVDKIYQFVLLIANVSVIYHICKLVKQPPAVRWMAVLLWILMGKVIWSFNNNVLENTMCFFCLISVYFLLKHHTQQHKNIWITWIGASIALLLAFLSKGFPGLFPLAFYFALFIAFKSTYPFAKMVKNSAGLIVVFGLIVSVFFIVNPEAFEFVYIYIKTQVVESLEGKRQIMNRSWILQVMFNEYIPCIAISIILLFFALVKKHKSLLPSAQNKSWIVFFIALGLCGSLPILISPKQLSFYIIPSTPYMVIATAIFTGAALTKVNQLWLQKHSKKIMTPLYVLAAIALVLTVRNYGSYFRDKKMYDDMHLIAKTVLQDGETTLNTSAKSYQQWTMFAYFKRFYNIDFNRFEHHYKYKVGMKNEPVTPAYKEIELPTTYYKLEKVDTTLYDLRQTE